ncbi:MAG: acyltransferase [Betaproteobacteria bacterium]|nr:acyltransferase [Betaproteobacteria bacterium]
MAVLCVLLYHLNPAWLPGGYVGVDVFFVISGFVVTASLAGHDHDRPGAFLGEFYARRLARLVPALVAMLVVTTALQVLFVPRTWFNRAAETVGQAAFWGFSNWSLDGWAVNYFEARAELNPFTHTWSLGVEEQFYLIAPLLLFFALGTRFAPRTRRAAAGVIAVLALLSLAACAYYGFTRGGRFVFYLLVYRFWELAAGVLLFLGGRRLAPLAAAWPRLHAASGWVGLALVALALGLPKPTAYPWARAAVAVAGALLLVGLPTVLRRDRLQTGLSHPAMLWLGRRSYALYLWHWPVYVLARWTVGLEGLPFKALAVGLSLAAAAASYRFVEHPVRSSARLRRWPVAARIGLFALLLGGGWGAGQTLLTQQPALGLGQPTRQAADWYAEGQLLKTAFASQRQCEPVVEHAAAGSAPQGLTLFDPRACVARTTSQLFVIGDSHATAYLPLLEQLSAEQGRTVAVLQVPGCAYLDLIAPMTPEVDPSCHRAATAAMQAVLQRARPGDVVFLPSLRLPRLIYLGGDRRDTADIGGDVFAHTPAALAAMRSAAADAPRWLTPFTDAGLRVVFELPPPLFQAHAFQCVDWFNRTNPACAGGLVERRSDQERYRAPVVATIHELAARHPGVSTWDPMATLCNARECRAMRGRRPLFFDGDHLSPYGNAVLLPALRAALD